MDELLPIRVLSDGTKIVCCAVALKGNVGKFFFKTLSVSGGVGHVHTDQAADICHGQPPYNIDITLVGVVAQDVVVPAYERG